MAMEQRSPSTSRNQQPHRAHRILVVDDEPMIARGIKSMLGRLGHPAVGEVQTAFSGAEAISRIESWEPEVVILDIRMPGLSGLDVLERCRSTDGPPHFFVLSGHDEFDYVKRAFKLGALDYLLKPASMADLGELLETAAHTGSASWKETLADDITARWSLQMGVERVLDTRSTATLRDAIQRTDIATFPTFRMSILRTPRAVPESALTMRKTIGSRIWEISQGEQARAFFFWTPESDLGLLWNVRDRDTTEPMRNLWLSFARSVREAPGTMFAVGTAANIDASAHELYEQVSAMLLYRFTPDAPHLITTAEVRTSYGVPAIVDVSDAVRAARAGEVEAIERATDEVFADSPRGHGSALADAYASLVGGLAAYCERTGISPPRTPSIAELDTPQQVRKEIGLAVQAARTAARQPNVAKDPAEYALEYVESHLHEDLDMAHVASAVGLSYSHFSRVFKDRTGEGFGRYLLERRMRRARRMLDDPAVRVSEVAYAVGYRTHKHFSRAFRDYFGQTPTQYRSGAR